MSKKKTEETHEQTTEESTLETTQTDTPPDADTPAQSKPGKAKKTGYVCPNCQHTPCVKIGAPYQKGELTLQYVQCKKCNHLGVEEVRS